MRIIFWTVCFSVIFFYHCDNAYAWNDEITHRALTRTAAQKSVLSISFGDYLKHLGYSNGTEEFFSLNGHSKKVWKWIEDGGEEEDAGNVFTAYYYNHFHNPRFAWSEAGLNTIYPYINGISSVLWAQDDVANSWSWQRARDYYRLALSSSTKAERDANFANTFKGVGHIMHLVEDAAQPAHVRNDPHPLDDKGVVPGFEYWAKNRLNQAYVSNLMQSPAFPSLDLNTSVGGYVPITQFIDTDQGGGISEYTNANFFSEDTIFTEPSPSLAETVEYEETINGETRIYLKSTLINHLAATRWFYLYLSDGYKGYGLKLDDNVYNDYAALLIPRAVGYSAGLINYFFRGQIDMKPDTQNAGKYVIENLSNEDMSGAFSLYYDDENDNRNLVTNWNLSISAGGKSDPVEFTEPTDAKEKGKYMLVFNGTLGAEEGAVAGKVVTFEQKKELILYAVNSVYKTFDPETKEVKPYSGILQGATGRVVWRDDGDAAWAIYGKAWNIVNTEKNTVRSTAFSGYYYSGIYYGATVGWKGETPIAMQIQYKSPQYYIFYSEFLPDGGFADYAFASPGDINRVDYTMSQFSWDGEEMTGIGYREPYYNASSGDYYLINLNTVVKELSAVKVGRASGYSATNVPVSIAYYDDSLNVIYRNGDGARSVQGDYACPDSQITENLSSSYTYDLLGAVASSLTRTTTCYATLSQQQGTYFWPVISYTIMKDGQAVVLYSYQEFSSSGSSSPYFSLKKSRMTPYLYIGGNKYADASAELNSNSGANLYTNYESLVNLNGNKNKAIAMLRTRSYAYNNNGAYDVAKTAMVYYISDGSVSNIINDNPDFKDATFFTFIKK